MKALSMRMERYLELKQRMISDSNFKPKIYDVLDFRDDVPEVELINENWVKVKVKMSGICGTDIHLLTIEQSTCLANFASFPGIPGHEIVGVVTEVGKNAHNIQIGDRVLIDENLSCEVRGLELCDACKEGDFGLCYNLDKGDIAPGTLTGYLCIDTGGGWGEYIVAHKIQILKIPESVSFEEALISEALAGSIHGVFKCLPKDTDNVVVVGCGVMGLAAILALKSFSKCSIIAIDTRQQQLDFAKNLGADDVFLAKKDLHIKKIARKLGIRTVSPPLENVYPVGGGADVVFDCVGNASSLNTSLRLVKPKGNVILIGYPSHMEIDWTPIMAKEISITGSNIFGSETIGGERKRTMQIALDLISSGKIDVSDFVTHKFALDDYKEALEVASKKDKYNSIKVVFEYD